MNLVFKDEFNKDIKKRGVFSFEDSFIKIYCTSHNLCYVMLIYQNNYDHLFEISILNISLKKEPLILRFFFNQFM